MQAITTTQVFEFELSAKECAAIKQLLVAMGTKAKFEILKEARVEVKIRVEVEEQKEL